MSELGIAFGGLELQLTSTSTVPREEATTASQQVCVCVCSLEHVVLSCSELWAVHKYVVCVFLAGSLVDYTHH